MQQTCIQDLLILHVLCCCTAHHYKVFRRKYQQVRMSAVHAMCWSVFQWYETVTTTCVVY